MAVIRSCWADGLNHVGSVCQMNTGSILAGRPSLGAWVTYGLGTANKNLPTFVVLSDDSEPLGGGAELELRIPAGTLSGHALPQRRYADPRSEAARRSQRRAAAQQARTAAGAEPDLGRRTNPDDTELDARIRSYELAYQMQAAAPEAVDLRKETEATKKLYGMDEQGHRRLRHQLPAGPPPGRARRALRRALQRRRAAAGTPTTTSKANHTKCCGASDKPIAGLLTDLKARGLLKDTLVVWGGEFGRTPFNERPTGRDHNPWGFTMWMAGGGVKGGQYVGTTDDIGLRAVENPVHVHDIHATILWMLGLDHIAAHLHAQRPRRAPDRSGRRSSQGSLRLRIRSMKKLFWMLPAGGALASPADDPRRRRKFSPSWTPIRTP